MKKAPLFMNMMIVAMFVFLMTATYILYDDAERVVLLDYETEARAMAPDLISTSTSPNELPVQQGTELAKEFRVFVPVLMYHDFEAGAASSLVVDPERFRQQLTYLQERGYETITVFDLVQAIYGSGELPAKPLLITLDDGYESNYLYAFPILQELQMKATINVVTSQRGATPAERTHFTWEQAREMVDSGLITLQSHTHNLHHKIVTAHGLRSALVGRQLFADGRVETSEQYRERVKADLEESKRLIREHVGQQAISLSYPYGVYHAEIEQLARELGFLLLFSIEQGVFTLEDSPHVIPRINVPGTYTGADIEREILKYTNLIEQ